MSVIFLSIVLINNGLACGTLQGRVERYFQSTDHLARFTELKFMVCGPIFDSYKGSQNERNMLLAMLLDASQRAADPLADTLGYTGAWLQEYYLMLSVKCYARYRLWEDTTTAHQALLLQYRALTGLDGKEWLAACQSLDTGAALLGDQGLALGHEAYLTMLREQAAALLKE
ncbi:MAG: hypothetical protein HYZ16_04845 [Bacteroidetes bacterium]|jgi:hypothetical protein|nr:hypothetical protein [Bacteroidota bacterium]